MQVKEVRATDKNFMASQVKVDMWIKQQIHVVYLKAWRTLGKALEKEHRNYEDGYAKVPKLCAQIIYQNQDNVAKLSGHDTSEAFEDLCVTVKPCIDGWVAGCRPVLVLDGRHLIWWCLFSNGFPLWR